MRGCSFDDRLTTLLERVANTDRPIKSRVGRIARLAAFTVLHTASAVTRMVDKHNTNKSRSQNGCSDKTSTTEGGRWVYVIQAIRPLTNVMAVAALTPLRPHGFSDVQAPLSKQTVHNSSL